VRQNHAARRLRQRISVLWLITFGTLVSILLSFSTPLLAAPPLVNSPADNITVDGLCTLREAILSANGTPANADCAAGTNITFAAGVNTITVLTPLPPLTANGIIIDGFINGVDVINLVGTAGAGSGLTIQSGNNILQNLVIASFPQHGILIGGGNAQANTLRALYIGTDTAFSPGLGNGGNGILIANGAHDNVIGVVSAVAEDRLTIGNNALNGVEIRGLNSPTPADDTRQNRVVASNIGIRADFGAALPNGQSGVLITAGANNNILGIAGEDILSANVISGNIGAGVSITGALTTQNQVIEARIGVDLSTASPFPNALGVQIADSANNNIIGNGNFIISNSSVGILLDSGAQGNTITNGNIVRDNGGSGIFVTNGASNNVVINQNNIISNGGNGVEMSGATTRGNTVAANNINSHDQNGVVIRLGANSNVITSNVIENNTVNGVAIVNDGSNSNTVEDNTIRGNQAAGVTITGNAQLNTITENSILNNVGEGIDLGGNGATANDPDDADVGPNNLQNYPANLLAIDTGENTLVGGTMDGGANEPFRIEAFSNTTPNALGIEGDQFEGAANRSNGAFTLNLPQGIAPRVITLTATDSTGNTSEFSPPIPILIVQAAFAATPSIGTAPLNVAFTNQTTIEPVGTLVTYAWDFGDGSATSNAVNPSHLFSQPGTYTVTLTVTVSNGVISLSDTAELEIIVNPTNTATSAPPIASDTATATVGTLSATPTASITPSLTASATNTVTSTFTRTFTPTFTASATPSNTVTPSLTASFTPSATFTLTPTFTASFTATPIPTLTPSFTPSLTASATSLPTLTLTLEPSSTPTTDVTIVKEPADSDTFTIEIENGDQVLTNVVLEEALRPGVVYVSSSPGSPLCREQAGVISCNVGTLGGNESFQVDIQVDSEGVDIVSGQTTLRSDQFRTSIDDIYIVKSSQPPFAAPGEAITYSIRVINPTSRTISSLNVFDTMPEAVTISDALVTEGSGQISVDGQNITYQQATVAAGERITLTIMGQLQVNASGSQIANRACLTTATITRPRCAVAGFVRANALPATGEASPIHWVIMTIVAGLLITSLAMIRTIMRRNT
jgi:CSLREA domain-containing protein